MTLATTGFGPALRDWGSALLGAAAVTYAVGPLAGALSVAMVLPERLFMTVLLAAHALAFFGGIWVLRRRFAAPLMRIGRGLQVAGWMLLATVPVLLAYTLWISGTGGGEEVGVAYFALLIFGGAYAVQGLVALLLGRVARKRAGP